ncbi:uncharacterized protein K444DRAFT_398989 [Hyaloscypha bicolor E]|uniref:Secreted protein n=1 Tax=Hyaloscypha bicolor E TaxID=1095630 RepID=A0A2J6TAZ0_9HELO|nr:uncharacterized protein K444DRAFT_398989 [Hyaloscypha bicolor E]PMD60199.1 hypothetical protein K444DRAFT_398989 [Hyaloscypha bicolor E]
MKQMLRMRPKAMLILGVLNGTRVCITFSQSQNSPQHRQSLSMYPVHGMTSRRGTISTSQLRNLGLASSAVYLLLPHKPNPRLSSNPPSHYKIRPAGRVSAVSLRARQWNLRFTPSPSLSIAAMTDGLIRRRLNWRKN